MGTFWHKPAYTRADRDADGEIRADALKPGIYCEDQAALDHLRRGARVRSREMTATPSGWLLDGQAVFLCTPEQAAMLRATATVTPEESLADQRAQAGLAYEAWRATIAKASEVLHDGVYGPDGKLDVMANLRECSKGIRTPEYRALMARLNPAVARGGAMDLLHVDLALAAGDPALTRRANRWADLRRVEIELVTHWAGADIVLDAILEVLARGGCVKDLRGLRAPVLIDRLAADEWEEKLSLQTGMSREDIDALKGL